MKAFKSILLVLSLVVSHTTFAQEESHRLTFAAVLGTAHVDNGNGRPVPVEVGSKIKVGAVIRTSPRSALDLYLGSSEGTLRLTQNTTIKVLRFDAKGIEFHLTTGSVLGLGNRIAKEKAYYIKTPKGILDTHAKQFRINTSGLVVGVEGQMTFAHIEDGKVTPHIMNCPPVSYFWPGAGVKPAPPALVREVKTQINARIHN